MTAPSPLRARLLLLAAAALFSTGGAAIKAASLTGWQVASFRSGIAALTLYLLLRGARQKPSGPALAVGAVYTATMILFVLANRLTTAANTIFLQDTAPLYVLLAAPLLLGEPVRRAELWFMAALASGLLLFFIGVEPPRGTAPDPLTGNVLAAASGVTWAGTLVGLRWIGTRRDQPHGTDPALVAGNAFACLAALPMALPVAGLGAGDISIVLFLGTFQIGLAYACLSVGIRGVPALEASLLLLLEPVLSPIWAWLVHGESPGRWSLAGGAVILAATGIRTVTAARAGTMRPAEG